MPKSNITNIFTTSLDNLANPQASYLFRVVFDGNDDGTTTAINNDDSCISMTATLPKAEKKTVTQWFKGTPMTKVTNELRMGETNLSFIITRDGLFNLSSLFNLYGMDIENISPDNFIHQEFYPNFNKIHIYLLKNNGYRPKYILNNNNINVKFTLYNCIVTNMDFGEVSYEGSDMVKLNMTVHYDYWRATEGTELENE